MENKTLLIAIGAVLLYFLFIRKSTTKVVVPVAAAGALQTPKPAIPQPTTAQVALSAGIAAAPQAIKALGSFYSSDSSDDSSDSDSASFSDDSSFLDDL